MIPTLTTGDRAVFLLLLARLGPTFALKEKASTPDRPLTGHLRSSDLCAISCTAVTALAVESLI